MRWEYVYNMLKEMFQCYTNSEFVEHEGDEDYYFFNLKHYNTNLFGLSEVRVFGSDLQRIVYDYDGIEEDIDDVKISLMPDEIMDLIRGTLGITVTTPEVDYTDDDSTDYDTITLSSWSSTSMEDEWGVSECGDVECGTPDDLQHIRNTYLEKYMLILKFSQGTKQQRDHTLRYIIHMLEDVFNTSDIRYLGITLDVVLMENPNGHIPV